MDVANYISELLMQNGEVTVPGLGYFVQLKVDGYYDSKDGKFYPPANKIQFDPQYHDDEVLLKYIAEKKNISLASSKYFTAKFIDNLTQEAMIRETPVADLGTLHLEEGKLIFKPAGTLPVDPTYYGYQPIEAAKLGGTSFHEQLEKEIAQPSYVPVPPLPAPEPAVPIGAPPVVETPQAPVTPPAPVTPQVPVTPPVPAATPEPEIFAPQPSFTAQPAPDHEEEFIFSGRGYSDEPVEKNNNWIWITITAIVVLAIVGVFALYKFKPEVFNRLRGKQAPPPLVLKTPVIQDTAKVAPAIKVDTATTPAKKVVADTISKPAAVNKPTSGIDSTKARFEIIDVSFKTLAAANKVVANLKSTGLEAYIVNPAPGRKIYNISLGAYPTRAEAMTKINELVKAGKIKPGAWPLEINPKK